MPDPETETETVTEPATEPAPREAPWWKTSVAFQIYPRSFCDTTGNGVGDLDGIRVHLDHLVELGVDAIWLSPFFRSPMADYGYDVADYCDVDPLFGDLATFDALLAEAHGRDLKVIIDWVPNHTSIEHPWFAESRSSRENPKRDWYVWRDPAPHGGPPNNWIESLTFGPAWTLDETTGQYYLHCFLSEQPDLNWHHPDVVAAMHDTLRFWLDRGVDGFRMDVVHLIGKDPALPDEPPEYVGLPHTVMNDRPETHELLRGIRELVDSYDGDRMAIGEIYLLDTDLVASYYGDGDELHLCFNFPPLYTPWQAPRWRDAIRSTIAALAPRHAWPTWVLSNHDNPRHRSRYAADDASLVATGADDLVARAAALLLLTLRGTPFLYAGEELGLTDAVVADHERHDPAGRDGCRAPIPWTTDPRHGWSDGAAPWLPWPPDADTRNVEAERGDPTSMLTWYQELLALRRAHPVLQLGTLELIESDGDVVAYERRLGSTTCVVAINMSAVDQPAPAAGAVLASSAPGASGTLAPWEARLTLVGGPA